jgi:hypothetical protein
MGGLMVRFFPLAVEDLSCPDLTELARSPRARLRPPTEAAESVKKKIFFVKNCHKSSFKVQHTLFLLKLRWLSGRNACVYVLTIQQIFLSLFVYLFNNCTQFLSHCTWSQLS